MFYHLTKSPTTAPTAFWIEYVHRYILELVYTIYQPGYRVSTLEGQNNLDFLLSRTEHPPWKLLYSVNSQQKIVKLKLSRNVT